MIQTPIVTNRTDTTSGPGTVLRKVVTGVRNITKKKRQVGGKGSNLGRVMEDISCRTFASKGSSGEEEHIVIVRGPSNVACSLSIQAGTDDSYAPVKIKRATNEQGLDVEISDERLVGLTFDQGGLLKLRVAFDSSERYSLNVTAYEV
ncbi:MAG: hypothetical protein A2754_03115 [Candidatus Magasanikbacteria bacterium RIFCSPHIGHO2_01_FULL_47_8]|uniref:Uncharacterized protein n=1 Tax=Candidatus Magasanikbacteria bacterium RIFCSPHIGHO2_01_FULL_47_8 TaxID=1798673 RepID=A0A1F6MG19_9BACT|nr:MAG: hypothetical protein A2754_03115 [Candidatus Magasanikbacteria bacterium RIFCSPHIGHO2_01_FULL_47_8]